MKHINWGIISTAKIGRNHLIPAIKKSRHGTVKAIASRDLQKAKGIAGQLGIPNYYGSYDELLNDNTIQAVYNPLPNHLHVPLTIKALEAGKHVLCEKPIALDSEQAEALLNKTREFPDLKVMEAFMYRFHPQWKVAKKWLSEGEIGELESIQSVFSYYNRNPGDIRNQPNMGGGGLMDIGCYCISLSRFLFDREPDQVFGIVDMDPDFGVDKKASAILSFDGKTSTFTCSTQMQNYQRVKIFGAKGMIELEIPFNAPADRSTKIHLSKGDHTETVDIEAADQYQLQADSFCESILNDTPVPTPLDDAVKNMRVIDAVFESGKTGLPVKL